MAQPSRAPTVERDQVQGSQDRKVTPTAYWLKPTAKRGGQWVPRIKNAFNLPAIDSCPGSTDVCQEACYATNFGNYANVDAAQRKNFELVRAAEQQGEEAVYRLLSPVVARCRRDFVRLKIKSRDWFYRIHSSGDMYSVIYAGAWRRVAEENPEILFLVYTRSFTAYCNVVPILVGLENLTVYISSDARNNPLARQVADRHDLPVAAYGVDVEHGRQLLEGRNRRAIVCPENDHHLELTSPDRQDPTNGVGACLKCRICLKGRYDVIFIGDKHQEQPVLFSTHVNLDELPDNQRQCRNRFCHNVFRVVRRRGRQRQFCCRECQDAEYHAIRNDQAMARHAAEQLEAQISFDELPPGQRRCRNRHCCNTFVVAGRRGRPRQFCSPACRLEEYHASRNDQERARLEARQLVLLEDGGSFT